jgi:hypothetical protein
MPSLILDHFSSMMIARQLHGCMNRLVVENLLIQWFFSQDRNTALGWDSLNTTA